MKSLLIFLILSSATLLVEAQSVVYKHTFSIEALGVGRYGSMGYKRLLLEDNIAQYQLRTGLAVMRLYNYENKLNPDFSIPLMVEAVIGKGRN